MARTLLGTWDGAVGSLPATIADGSDHYWTFNYTVPTTQDPNTMHVVGWVNEPITGNIYNSARSVGAIVGMHQPASENFDVRIYPNPSAFATNIKVELKKSAKVSVEVYDITGRTVYSSMGKTLASGEFIYPLQVSQLADGLYSVKITVDNEQITKRLVVQQ